MRPTRRQMRQVLHEVALAMPPDFDGMRMVGGLNQTLDLSALADAPASMVLELMGVRTGEDLLTLLRGLSTTTAVVVAEWALGAATGDDVRACTVLVADETHPIPPSLLV